MIKNIFLCGFMGSGKTTIGKKLAISLGKNFVDLDNFIEQNENIKIKNIFEKNGEDYFRKLETQYLIKTCKTSNSIISLGGGTLENQQNIDIIKQNGIIVFIDIPFELCYLRIIGNSNRPIVISNTKEKLEEIYNNRKINYIKNCDYHINFIGNVFQTVQHLKFKLKN